MREAGAWTILDAPVSAEEICESLLVGNYEPARTKAS